MEQQRVKSAGQAGESAEARAVRASEGLADPGVIATGVMPTGGRAERLPFPAFQPVPVKKAALAGEIHLLTRRQKGYLAVRRVVDFAVALILLSLLCLPFLLIALIQKITAPKERVFFRQIRLCREEKEVRITKFRSMSSKAPPYLSKKDFQDTEQYTTRFGRFLRNTSIDELAQLFQVLSGALSLIGPRPLIPQETEVHRMRREAGVYQLRPGITGWAQVNGRDFLTDEEKVAYDREYLEKVGLKMDILIICKTVKKVFCRADIRSGG